MLADPANKIITKDDDGQSEIVKGIELKPEINNKAIGTVIPSSTFTTNNSKSNNKKK